MATLNQTYLTLADKFSREDGKGGIAKIIEMLAKTNPILEDAPVVECNMGTYHRTTHRTALPAPSWRVLNQGSPYTKSRTNQFDDSTGLLEDWSRIDAELMNLAGDKAEFRLSEAAAHIEGMNQEMASTLFYGNTNTNPEEILGLAPRYNSTTAENGNQVLLGGGAGSDNTSIYIVGWGPNTVHLLYPKGTTAGLEHKAFPVDTVYDANGNPYEAYQDKFCWRVGLCVRDYRYVVRIPNIDVSALTVDASTGANLFNLLINAYWQFNQRRNAMSTPVIYTSTVVMKYLDHQSRRYNSNVQLTWREVGPDSKPVLHFRDMPIKECDAITEAEALAA